MRFEVTDATGDELDALAALAAGCQRSPRHRIPLLSDDAEAIRADVLEAAGDRPWYELAVVARQDDQTLGWLFAERDLDRGRIWWFGPCIAVHLPDAEALAVASSLYASAQVLRPGFPEEEICYDARSELLAEFGRRHGFQAQEGSLALRLDPPSFRPQPPDARIEAVDDRTGRGVAALHDRTFPGTHRTGQQLLASAPPRHRRWCAVDDDQVIGYVATEVHNDGSLYVDYLGVDPSRQSHGVGRALVAHALAEGLRDGATYAHLTVRTSNERARRLYASLGFVEEWELVPARKGFALG